LPYALKNKVILAENARHYRRFRQPSKGDSDVFKEPMRQPMILSMAEAIIDEVGKRWVDAHPPCDLRVHIGPMDEAHKDEACGHTRVGKEHRIALNSRMVPESLLTTFFHELGHVTYEVEGGDAKDIVASEMAAIRACFNHCAAEGLEWLAYREAAAITQMAKDEPFKSAVARLQSENDPLWLKYARRSPAQ
jgi:hypothetical protein